MNKYIIIIALMLFMFSSSSDLLAQQGQRQGGQRQQGRDGQMGPGPNRQGPQDGTRPGMQQRRQGMQDLKRIERLRMMKLLDLLDLDTDTEALVIPHIRKHHKQLFNIMRKHQRKIDQLAIGLKKNKFSDDEIIKRIKEIDGLEVERHEKIRSFHRQASEILTAEQLGKLYVFQARFGGEVLEKMRDYKNRQNEQRKQDHN